MEHYIGLDIGATKIAGGLIAASGRILSRTKTETPKKARPQDIYASIREAADVLIRGGGLRLKDIKGMGVGVPGIVNTRSHHILAAPNIALAGFPIRRLLTRKFKTRVVVVNDVNAGLLGETWKGAAKGFLDVVGLFPGTGVGGAVISRGQLLLGSQGAATELGHMIMEASGPLCHCGNYGCLEALSSRWAIERDIRLSVKRGVKTIIAKLNNNRLDTIKARVLKEALRKKDPLVKNVLTKMARVLGKAAVSLNHIFNPQAIILGGGVIKACGDFIVPIVAYEVKADPFFKKFNSCRVLPSLLGDDAVILGAARLSMGKP